MLYSISQGPIVVEMLQGPPVGIRPLSITLKPVSSFIMLPIQLDITGVFLANNNNNNTAGRLKNHLINQLKTIVNCVKVCAVSLRVVITVLFVDYRELNHLWVYIISSFLLKGYQLLLCIQTHPLMGVAARLLMNHSCKRGNSSMTFFVCLQDILSSEKGIYIGQHFLIIIITSLILI